MKWTGLLIAFFLCVTGVAATLTVNYNVSSFNADDRFSAMGFGRWYTGSGLWVESNSGGTLNAISNENVTREQLANRSVRRIRLDVNSGISSGVNTFVNTTVTADTRIQSHIDTFKWASENDIELWLIMKMPSWNVVNNPAICQGSFGIGSGSGANCYISNNSTYREFIGNYLDVVTQNGLYVPRIVVEPLNEPDWFYWLNTSRTSTQFLTLNNHLFNETIKGFAESGYAHEVAGPSLCGGCESSTNRRIILRSILGNFSNNITYVSDHPYPGSYATWPTDIDAYLRVRIDDVQASCDAVGHSPCRIVLTETGYNDVTANAPAMNNDPRGMYNAFAEIYRVTMYYKNGNVSLIPFQAQCYTFSRSGQCEFPKQWTIMPNPSLTNLTTGPGNFTLDFAQTHGNGAKVNNYTTTDSNVVAIATNTSGAYGLTIINRDQTTSKNVNVTINGFTAVNRTAVRNGTTTSVTGNTFTVVVGVNETYMMYFNGLSAFQASYGNCSYSGSGDWIISGGDNCVVTGSVDLGGNNVYITGPGTFTLSGGSANIFNAALIRVTGAVFRLVGGATWG